MLLNKIKVVNFKNYSEQNLVFNEPVNCFVGKNGMGKTNMLDAIYYLAMCKSACTPQDRNVIQHQANFFRIEGNFISKQKTEQIIVKYAPPKHKVIERNGVAYKKFSEHIGIIPVVLASPDDTLMAREGSEMRRHFLDTSLSQLDRNYLAQLIQYQKVLDQRNAFLKKNQQSNQPDLALLEAYKLQLLAPSQYIHEKRKEFIQAFNPIFEYYYQKIAQTPAEKVSCEYRSSLLETDLASLLEASWQQDRILQRTTKGIHRDDLIFQLNGFAIKRFASQGQLKSFILALKLAQLQLLKQKNETSPILLLDDIFDKLDEFRVRQLLQLLLDEHLGQIFLTDTNKARLEEILLKCRAKFRIFEVENGKIQD